MHEEVRASFLNLARDDETSDDADAKEAAGDTEMEDAEVAGGEGQSTEAGAETGAHSPVGASPEPAVSDAVEVTGERSWEETGPPPAAPAPAADRFDSFLRYDEDDDTAAEEGRKRSLDETDYAAPPPQM